MVGVQDLLTGALWVMWSGQSALIGVLKNTCVYKQADQQVDMVDVLLSPVAV